MRTPSLADLPLRARALIDALNLAPHPEEGGWFVETWRCGEQIPATALPTRYVSRNRTPGAPATRAHGTCIYYLLTPDTLSALHRLQSDEIFHFYLGDPVEMLQLFPDGTGRKTVLGSDPLTGQTPQHLVPHGVWQGARLMAGGSVALMGCTVAPGFEFVDYDHGDRAELIAAYPDFAEDIVLLTTD